MTLGEAVSLYLQSLSEGQEAVHQELAQFARWCGRDRPLRDLTPAQVADYRALLPAGPAGERRAKAVRDFLAFLKARGLTDRNLGSSLRAPRAARQPTSGRPAPEAVALTPEGRAQLEEQVRVLQEELVRASEEVRRAAADKDVRENAPLEAARERHGLIASRIREIEAILSRAQVITSPASGRVRLGSRVTLRDLATGREVTYLLVSPQEANPNDGKISVASPLGRALLDRQEGEEVRVTAPRGVLTYRLVRVE